MPSNTPELENYGFSIEPGSENFMSIRAEAIHSTENINSISLDYRNCFLESERKLHYYTYYSYFNCFLECAANYTLKVLQFIQMFFYGKVKFA